MTTTEKAQRILWGVERLEDFYQFSVFDIFSEPFKIDKPIRLIELFAGIGSQAKALERIGADFEHYRTSEWEVSAVASYKAIHKYEDDTDYSKPYSNEELLDILCNLGISTDGKKPMTRQQISRKNEQWKKTVYNNFKATNNVGSIVNISGADLGIVDTDKYTYLLTYSFPCQDLSLAGKQKLMAKGSGTRSSLLWEVERLLNECEELPQVLLMENVTQVHGKKNMEHFQEWIDFLESKGYSNYWKDLNAKNFGIPQNRNRTFMVSVLGNYTYEFPEEFPLQLRLKHLLEDCVDEKYYLSGKMVDYLHSITEKNIARGNGNIYSPSDVDGCSKCITTKEGSRVKDNFIEEPKCKQVGMLTGGKWDKLHDISRRVYSGDGVSPTIHTSGGGQQEPKIIDDFYKNRDERVYEDVSPTLRADRVGLKVAEPFIVASRGRNPDNPSDRTLGIPTEQRLEPNFSGCSNTLTTVQKDNYVAEPLAYDEQNGYIRKDGTVGTLTTDGSSPKHNNRVVEGMRIRKLTPKECWRLMGFDDADFEKAAQFNSNSQLYKQAGNSIVVDVLAHIFTQMF